MNGIVRGIMLAIAVTILAPAASAAPVGRVGIHPTPAPVIEKAQSERYCRRLRRACEFKHERGEAGEGNCRRYRRECGRWWR